MLQAWTKEIYDGVVQVIHWELCKKLKFYHANKMYTHKTKSLLDIERLKTFWDFKTETDHPI